MTEKKKTPPANIESCTIYCAINLGNIFDSVQERKRFNRKWLGFLKSDPPNRRIYKKHGDLLEYQSEQLIPAKKDARPPLLLVFGNPASYSVASGMFFSFDKDGREARFWKHILEPSGILSFPPGNGSDKNSLNTERRRKMFALEYDGPFRVGLCVLISTPSPAGGPWGGVAGVQKLFGKKTFDKIETEEQRRVIQCAQSFAGSGGAVVTFQKNAWNALRSDKDPAYSIGKARAGELVGSLKADNGIPLYGAPPTRLVAPCRQVLSNIVTHLSSTQYIT